MSRTSADLASARKDLHALVADDSKATRRIFRSIFESMGIEIAEASDGAEALRLLEDKHGFFDMVINDSLQVIRGVGLDLVQTVVGEFDGTVQVETAPADFAHHLETLLDFHRSGRLQLTPERSDLLGRTFELSPTVELQVLPALKRGECTHESCVAFDSGRQAGFLIAYLILRRIGMHGNVLATIIPRGHGACIPGPHLGVVLTVLNRYLSPVVHRPTPGD